MTLTIGARLGTYEILGSLGAGGMGEVYRAKDLRLEREIAIKDRADEVPDVGGIGRDGDRFAVDVIAAPPSPT
jgi:serine/threonine protein kinase